MIVLLRNQCENMTEQPRKRSRKWDVPAENIERDAANSSVSGAAQKARERAAKLAAKLAAEGKLATGIPPPPIIAPSSITRPSSATKLPAAASQATESMISDLEIVKLENGGYMAELEINDLPARVNLTKRAVQDKISLQSGAAIVTKGRYVPPEGKDLLKGQGERPLYLNIQAPIEAKVQVALHMIKDAVKNFGKPDQSGNQNGGQNLNYVQDKIFVGLDFAPPEYNIKEKLEGPNGSYLQHIVMQTGAKVHLRGKGSGYIDQNSGRESFEALHVYISHPKRDGLQAAKSLCESLLQSVHGGYKTWDQVSRQTLPHQQGYSQQPYQQPPTIYPSLNLPPPRMGSQNVSLAPAVYPQISQGSYQQQNYPPPSSYANQPPPTFRPPYDPPYSQPPPSQHSVQGYPSSKISSVYPPINENRNSIAFAPPQDTLQPQYQVNSTTASEQHASKTEATSTQRKRRRFTEDPALIRKVSEQTESKESTSHSLDSNTKFRSTGEPAKEASRDHRDAVSPSRDTEKVSKFLPPRDVVTSKRDIGDFKPPSLLPVAARKPSKKRTSNPKNALSSLLAYDDSDSDDES